MASFSEKLIQEAIDCFREENGLELTPETAEEYLASFAGLFLAFAKENPRPDALASGAGLLRAKPTARPEVFVTPRERGNLQQL